MPKVIKGKTDLWTTAPHIANLLLYPEHGYSLSLESHKKDDFVCPDCGTVIKNKIVRTVTRYGLKCPICSDGVSYPEKFVANILRQLHIDYIHDNSYEWSNNKRYDFYIKDLSLIVETHGIQHYSNESTFHIRNDSSEKEKANDIYKKEIALQSGIQNYIELDCRHSEFKYLKESILNSELGYFLNLSLVDWNKLEKDCQKSKVVEVCDVYNSGIKNTVEISKMLGIDNSTVSNYLRRCNEAGLCKYEPHKCNIKRILCVETGKFYDKLTNVKQDGFSASCVSEVCNGKQEHHKGYHFKFV